MRHFGKGKFELVNLGNMTIGRASYEPGWRWSTHVGPASGTASCEIEHVGMVVSGRARVLMNNGTEFELAAGELFYVAPGHCVIFATLAGWLW